MRGETSPWAGGRFVFSPGALLGVPPGGVDFGSVCYSAGLKNLHASTDMRYMNPDLEGDCSVRVFCSLCPQRKSMLYCFRGLGPPMLNCWVQCRAWFARPAPSNAGREMLEASHFFFTGRWRKNAEATFSIGGGSASEAALS